MSDNLEENRKVPAWIETFLHRVFFGSCRNHRVQKNELNIYCITCDVALCRYCLTTNIHKDHNMLKIYRHVYQDVVLLREMQNYIDCSKIQPYKCNKKWIIAMNPLPHCGSGAQIDGDLSCLVCKRKLMNPGQYRYCCMACQVEALLSDNKNKQGEDSPSVRLVETSRNRRQREIGNVGLRKRKRKGIPIKAPLR